MIDPPFRPPPKYDPSRKYIRVGGPIDETSIALRVFGDDLIPKEVTERLRIEPTSHCLKGDIFRGKRYDRIEKTGKWLHSRPHVTGDVDEIVQSLLGDLPADAEVWNWIHRRFDADLFLGIWMNDWNRGFTIDAATSASLGERGLTIGYDIYCDTSSDS